LDRVTLDDGRQNVVMTNLTAALCDASRAKSHQGMFFLRTGLATIAALGLVAGDYHFENAFDDVNGWDLQHTRRVRWCRLAEPHAFDGSAFGANPARCSRVWGQEVVEFAERFLNSPPTYWQTAPLPKVPAEEPPPRSCPRSAAGDRRPSRRSRAAVSAFPLLW
jgi:hypothetical protein